MNGMAQRSCNSCGREFEYPRSHGYRRNCSIDCYREARKRSIRHRECLKCGRPFTTMVSQDQRYCSRDCKGLATRRRITADCATCGRSFTYPPSQGHRKYCRASCYHEPRQVDKWGTINCGNCGKEFSFLKSAHDRIYCSWECSGTVNVKNLPPPMTGEQNPNWHGGYEPYYGPSWRAAQTEARQRDRICQGCGVTPRKLGKSLDVHHIVPFRLYGISRHEEANDLANLIAYCPTCHLRREWADNWRSS